MAEVTAYRVGHCSQFAACSLAGAGWHRQPFHAHAYVVESSLGRLLWDTGYARHFASASARGVYRMYPAVTPVDYGIDLHVQLLAGGIEPGSITSVGLSHFHADHIAGLRDFPGRDLLCSFSAWKDVRGRRGIPAICRAFLPDLLPDDAATRLRFVEDLPYLALPSALRPFTHGWDLGADGELMAVDLPGHAVGHIGLFVHGKGGWTLLAGDAAWHLEAIAHQRLPGALGMLVQHDNAAYGRTLKALCELFHRGEVRIRLAHDDQPDRPPGAAP